MLFHSVNETGDSPVGDTVARAQQTTGPAATTTLWPLTPVHPNQQSQNIPPLTATPAPAHTPGANRYGLYSLLPGAGGGGYVTTTPATPGPPTPTRAYHATTHKVSESLFSAAVGVGLTGCTWGAPTPPPGSPYSPVPVTQLELLAKNLANLAPPPPPAPPPLPPPSSAQQALSLQNVGVNVGGLSNLHHAPHTQHMQHTLNFAGLHHLHHDGFHQSAAFSPQLSLVTGSAPTLTINNFSSPNSTGNVASTTGVLLQEYQSPTGSSTTGCSVTVNGSSCLTNTSTSNSSGVVMHGGQAVNQTVQAVTKKREAFLSSQGQPVKLENKSTRTSCLCRNSNGKTKIVHSEAGCSRTLPVVSSWNGQDNTTGANNNGASLVKREPLTTVPCQVAEVSTSLHATTTSVKIEPLPAKSENGIVVPNAGANSIPVGIAVARQRLQHQETSMRNVSLSHHTSHHASYHHFQPDSFGSSTAMAVGGTTLLHCSGPGGEDRAAHLAIPSGAIAPSLNLNSTLNSTLNSALGGIGTAATDGTIPTWPSTLWQYPTATAAAMPTEPAIGFPQMGVGLQGGGGLQLVRDPATGHLLLIHAAEQMQQAVMWPNYSHHNSSNITSSSLLLPPSLSSPSFQLLSDIGGARLVLTESTKRKQQSTLPFVKIETDCANNPTTLITSAESTKALQTVTSMTGALVPDAPLLTTLHYYPHAPTLVQISQTEPTHCRSQATSPVTYLTPPPEVPAIPAIEPPLFCGVQDASNQTDALDDSEEQSFVKQEQNLSPCQIAPSTNVTTTNFQIVAPDKICNVVRITTTTTTVNPSVCGIVAKVDKAENTIINMADCAKYLMKDNRGIRTTEHGRSIDDKIDERGACKNDKTVSCKENRIGARIIEITEENCDSFHENLEFFGRRRDTSVEEQCATRDNCVKSKTEDTEDRKVNDEEKVTANTEMHSDVYPTTSLCLTETVSTADLTTCKSKYENSDNSDKRDSLFNETRHQSTTRSFDMPNIDYDDQEMQQMTVKQEAHDSCYETDHRSSPCDVMSIGEDIKPQESTPKKCTAEKCHTTGIENVVEKLKKNAAALQEATLPSENIEESMEGGVKSSRRYAPRRLENGLKKHILRFCRNEEFNSEVVSSSQNANDENRCASQAENNTLSLSDDKCDLAKKCLHSDNNNDSTSNNNNIKPFENKIFVKKEKLLHGIDESEMVTYSEMPTGKQPLHTSRKFEFVDETTSLTDGVKSKVSKENTHFDFSGLELLSNSIEQLEQRVGQLEHVQSSADNEKTPVRGKLIEQQSSESNNNDVDSPLGLLCALAEQRFMEEVGDKVSKKLNLENSEEISNASRALLNLGRGGGGVKQEKHDERKYLNSIDDECRSERLKYDEKEINRNTSVEGKRQNRTQSDSIERGKVKSLSKSKKSTKRIRSEETIDNVIDNETIKDDGNISIDKYRARSEKEHHRRVSISAGTRRNDTCYGNDTKEQDNHSDFEDEVFPTQRANDVDNESSRVSMEKYEMYDHENSRSKIIETKKSLTARKAQRDSNIEDEWPNMDAMELDMRVRLADIQRQYKEKQKELSKLIPKKDDKKIAGRSRRKNSYSSSLDHGTTSDSINSIESPQSPSRSSSETSTDAISPLTPTVLTTLPKCNVNLVKLGEPRSHIKLLDNIPSIPISISPVTSPIPALPSSKLASEDDERNTATVRYDTSSPVSTTASTNSASKKRKVGRPRKFTSGNAKHLTETIVAKKPKSKSSLVGYVLSTRNRHPQPKCANKTDYTPLPFKSELSTEKAMVKGHRDTKTKTKPIKQTSLHNKNVISSIIAEKARLSEEVKVGKPTTGRIKPKLKAEVKVKNWDDDENDAGSLQGLEPLEISEQLPEETSKEVSVVPEIPEKTESSEQLEQKQEISQSRKRKHKSSSSLVDSDKNKRSKSNPKDEREDEGQVTRPEIVNRCKLTTEHLAMDQLRVLTVIGGLFYAGKLSAVQAPDVYAITLDGERNNKPHIHSREEILRDTIVEVCPKSMKEIVPGSRVCAYWSQHYSCLYPGTSANPTEPDPVLDEKFVSVEFDDGDSGRIALDDVRFLQPNYPIVEYDPNPLLSLGKRRRQASLSEEKRSTLTSQNVSSNQSSNNLVNTAVNVSSEIQTSETKNKTETKAEEKDELKDEDLEKYRERKRMKKKRKSKLKRLRDGGKEEGKRKHKRHKIDDDYHKHKHRKHRKHKHKHRANYAETSAVSSGESSCSQKSEEEPTQDILTSPVTEDDKPPVIEKEEKTTDEVPVKCEEAKPTLKRKRNNRQKTENKSKIRRKQESVESRSKMAAFLPARQLWAWAGKGYRRPGAKGRAKKQFFRAIQRGNEKIEIGDSAVFLSTGRTDRPYIGHIISMWETKNSNMVVKVKWFYHPEETHRSTPPVLKYPGALYQSPHMDENDVQTISHKCEVLPMEEFLKVIEKDQNRLQTIYDNNDLYYQAGYYDPTTYLLTSNPDVA